MQAERARNHLSAPLHQINVFIVIVNSDKFTSVTLKTFGLLCVLGEYQKGMQSVQF